MTNASPLIDHEHDLAALRGSYLRRPNGHAGGREWIRWAEEVLAAERLAREILAARDATARASG